MNRKIQLSVQVTLVTLQISLTCLLLIAAPSAQAGGYDHEPFTPERFEQLNDQGAPVLVEVRTDWCSTCEAQTRALAKLARREAFDVFNVLRLDWDEQKDQAEEIGAWRQSTLVLYADGEKVDQSIGETDPREIASFLGQILGCD